MKPLSQEMVDKLEEANFKKILLGLESGDEGVLKKCHKMITPNDAINALKMFAKTKISLIVFLIIGLPGETIKTVKETAKLVQKLQKIKYIYYDDCAVLTVYPGTEVYELMKQAGAINDDFWLTDQPTPLFTLENSQKQLFRYKEFLLNRIALFRYFTPAGFISQITMTPYIFKYIRNSGGLYLRFTTIILKRLMPLNLYNYIKRKYNARNK
jgi:radical SAM superfamily enzyme YgiQ (UPF0313 family)